MGIYNSERPACHIRRIPSFHMYRPGESTTSDYVHLQDVLWNVFDAHVLLVRDRLVFCQWRPGKSDYPGFISNTEHRSLDLYLLCRDLQTPFLFAGK